MEEFEKVKRQRLINALSYQAKCVLFAVVLEFAIYYWQGNEQILWLSINPVIALSSIVIMRHFIIQHKKFAEDHGTFMLILILMMAISN